MPIKPQGRPAHSKASRFRALVEVAKQRKRQGKEAGWRPLEKALEAQVPTRLIQWALRCLKARDRRRRRERVKRFSYRLEVLCKDVIWTEDGAHAGRQKGQPVRMEALKDRGTLGYKAISVGPPMGGDDVLVMLRAAKAKHGTLPLVWQTDGEGVYVEKGVQLYLNEQKVIHLLSRAHQPTDNGSAEIGIRELKAETNLGKGILIPDPLLAAVHLNNCAQRLYTYRLRGSRGFRSAKELTRTMPGWYATVRRKEFYREACAAIEKAVQGKNKTQARQAQREAIFLTLEKYRLVKQFRGGRPFRSQQLEKVL